MHQVEMESKARQQASDSNRIKKKKSFRYNNLKNDFESIELQIVSKLYVSSNNWW